ncbi:hypothetical protein HanRHA438_Chr17g0809131 [Helianthus annuus]|nr:hypothetical protein HanIR_Chr17g0866511 [Helianthus annuus]KAJ0447236.1 hypothetical protein HanHA89_Chr17g0703071 [Helianthus annuus]KAJ0825980.1 hypothetical protein HanRHA438_Chr17g0809131 [Helianthus annuus]
MQQHQIIEDPGFAPSFSYYSSYSKTSRAVAKVIREEEAARFHQNGHLEGQDFEFSLVLSDEESKSRGWNVFKRDTLVHDRQIPSPLEDSSSYSSSEANEMESPSSRIKCKKSSSTGSGSKRGILRFLLRRSNSECKGDSLKQKRNLGEVTKVGGRWKAQTPVHEQFYVQKRAENEVGKKKSYLPYRKDLVGLFAGKKIFPF